MRNFSGSQKDLFKYDLITAILKNFPDVTQLIGTSPLIIADNTAMFIFLTKNPGMRAELRAP